MCPIYFYPHWDLNIHVFSYTFLYFQVHLNQKQKKYKFMVIFLKIILRKLLSHFVTSRSPAAWILARQSTRDRASPIFNQLGAEYPCCSKGVVYQHANIINSFLRCFEKKKELKTQ